MPVFKIVEKECSLAVHGHFDTYDRAENHLKNVVPDYIRRGYFTNKDLKSPDDFIIVQS